jgi:hypothetical protein
MSECRNLEVMRVASVTYGETLSKEHSEGINVTTDEFCSCDKTVDNK